MSDDQQTRDEWQAWLEARGAAHPPCPACGEDEWLPGHSTVGLPHAILSGVGDAQPTGNTLRAFPVVCTNCGFIRFHTLP